MRTKRRRVDSYPGSEGAPGSRGERGRRPDHVDWKRMSVSHAKPPAAVIVLAAGSGTRMKSKRSKVLHQVCGRSMIGHVLAAARSVEPRHVVAVVGHGREEVGPHILQEVPEAVLAVQETQEGT